MVGWEVHFFIFFLILLKGFSSLKDGKVREYEHRRALAKISGFVFERQCKEQILAMALNQKAFVDMDCLSHFFHSGRPSSENKGSCLEMFLWLEQPGGL